MLNQLAASGDDLVKAFNVFYAYPFVDEVVGRDPQVARNLHVGDYTNLAINLEIDLTKGLPTLPACRPTWSAPSSRTSPTSVRCRRSASCARACIAINELRPAPPAKKVLRHRQSAVPLPRPLRCDGAASGPGATRRQRRRRGAQRRPGLPSCTVTAVALGGLPAAWSAGVLGGLGLGGLGRTEPVERPERTAARRWRQLHERLRPVAGRPAVPTVVVPETAAPRPARDHEGRRPGPVITRRTKVQLRHLRGDHAARRLVRRRPLRAPRPGCSTTPTTPSPRSSPTPAASSPAARSPTAASASAGSASWS